MNMKRLAIAIVVIGILLIVGISCSEQTSPTPKPSASSSPTQKPGVLKIGHPIPMSGPAAAWGDNHSKITQVYVDIVNKDGGVVIGDTRYKLEYYVADDKGTPTGYAEAADLLLDTNKVDVVIGEWAPALAAVFGPRVAQKNIIYIGSLNSFPGSKEVISPKWPTTFSVHWGGEQIWTRQVGELKKQGFLPNIKNVAVLTKDDTIGMGVLDALTRPDVKAMWEKDYGIKQVYAKQFAVATTDFTPYLREIAALSNKVDVLNVSSATASHLALIAKQAAEINPNIWPIVSVATLTDTAQYVKLVNSDKAAAAVYTASGAPWDVKGVSQKYLDLAKQINEAYKAKYGSYISYMGGYEYGVDPIVTFLEAARMAGSLKTADIVKVLETQEIEHLYGKSKATGIQTYGINHWLTYPSVITKVEPPDGAKATATIQSNLP